MSPDHPPGLDLERLRGESCGCYDVFARPVIEGAGSSSATSV